MPDNNDYYDNPHLENYFTSRFHRKGHNLSKESLKREERIIKLLVYLLSVNMKQSDRMISRFFHIDKDTVPAWVEEVQGWDESERHAITSELMTGKRLPDKDVLDDKYKQRPIVETDQAPEE